VRIPHIKEIFGHYGKVKDVDLPIDPRNGVPKGIATVVFHEEKDAEQAMFYLDGGKIDGNTIKVSFVLVDNTRRREESPPSMSTIFLSKYIA
jgi:RNA-binding protein with serine-rich domain 1